MAYYDILIVDDSISITSLVKNKLEAKGFVVATANDAFEAEKIINKHSISLILLDVNMPEKDGFKFCEELKTSKEHQDIPVIFITGLTEQEHILKGFEVGGVDYISKPFNTTELIARVSTHLKLKRSQQALKEALVRVESLARIDPLTKLSNRLDMKEKMHIELSQYYRTYSPFTLVIGDIDNFKVINDTYGHDAGDYVLVRLSELFIQNFRRVDSIGRWGGEEFLFLLPQTNKFEAIIIIERIRETIEQFKLKYENFEIKQTLSFGLCEYEQRYSLDQCIMCADKALYSAKATGKNKVVSYNEFLPGLDE